jgi:Ni/Co efflux regulator RcnB
MKRLISTTLAAALAFSAAGAATASAQPYQGPPGYNHDHDHDHGPGPGFYGPPGYHSAPPGGYNGWHRGGYYHGPRYVVRDYGHYHLRPPPRGYEWVQQGGQFVMIAVASGVIADILLNR